MPKRKSATLIPVSEEIIDEIASLAERIGKPIRKLVEEILTEGVKSYAYGVSLSQVVKEYMFFLEAKRLGFTLIPITILNKMYRSDDIKDDWVKAGKLLASMLRAQGNTDTGNIVDTLKPIIMDASEILLTENNDGIYKLTIVALGRNKNGIRALIYLVRGLLSGLGFTILKETIDEGIGMVEFRR